MTYPENIDVIMLIVAIILVLIIFTLSLVQTIRGKRAPIGLITIILLIIGVMLLVPIVYSASEIRTAEWVQIILMIGLVTVTAVYAHSTEKMAEEMKEQRIMTSQPRLIQKSVHEKDIWEGSTKDYFSHFEISNVGNIPAIEVESSLMDCEGNRSHSIRQTFLTNNDPPIKFRPSNITTLEETRTYYIVCEYQNIFSHGLKNPLYQTRLPFKISKSGEEGKIYMVAGELEFKEASEEERIDAFSRRSKPK